MPNHLKRHTSHMALSAFTLAAVAATTFAQDLPTSQPTLLVVEREHIKLGREADHQRIETQFSAALSKAKLANSYLVLTSITGASEAWTILPFASNAAFGELLKWQPANSAELTRIETADANVRTGVEQIHLVARSDLSTGAFPDVSMMRYWAIWIYHVRPGHTAQFDSSTKMFATIMQRAGVSVSSRVYAVLLGMPAPTYVIFRSVTSYAGFDDNAAAFRKANAATTPEERATLSRLDADAVESIEGNRYQLDPGMSYVSAETRAKDPAFWSPKKKRK